MDEFALFKGHRYATVVVDADTQQVLWVGGMFRHSVCCHGHEHGVRSGGQEHCPQAQAVYDPGYVKRDNAKTGALFELIAHRYEHGSLVITSNHSFSTWGSIFVDETMAVAAADRLNHHGYIFELKGESYRKKTAKAVTSAA